MSRLDFAPKLKEIEVTDIQKGLGVFAPQPNKAVSFAALKETLKKAGYTLNAADITIAGTLSKNDNGWTIASKASGQSFVLTGKDVERVLAGAASGAQVEISGDWKTSSVGTTAHEEIAPVTSKASARQVSGVRGQGSVRKGHLPPVPGIRDLPGGSRIATVDSKSVVNFAKASFVADEQPVAMEPAAAPAPEAAVPAAPIRVTSPGLTVFKGGAVTPRFYLIKQHLGKLAVNRQLFEVSASYTPSPRLQLEIEVPWSRTSYDNHTTSGDEFGLGNVTAWAKYRFFRKVKTYGDRQAAMRLGLELPTGKKDAPSQTQINVPAFVRQQLTPINGGLTPHLDVAFSQAGGRFIFGGNAEVMFRTERDGFRMGHEQRLNTDLEYVLPRDKHKPGGELFLILETTFVHRSTGRLAGLSVAGSQASEYYLAPGLQYAARPRFVIEGSVQFPVVRNTGPLVLRTDRNILLGVRYLF